MTERLAGWLMSLLGGVVITPMVALYFNLVQIPQIKDGLCLLGCGGKLLMISLTAETSGTFEPLMIDDELVEDLKTEHNNAFDGIAGRDITIRQVNDPKDNEDLPENLADIEAELLKDKKIQKSELTVFGWRRKGVTWLSFLPPKTFMRAGLHHYNPQGRVIRLPNEDLENGRGDPLIAAFGIAQVALANKDKLSADKLRHLVAAKARAEAVLRAKSVLDETAAQGDPELLRAYAIILLAIEDQNRRDPIPALGRNDAVLADLVKYFEKAIEWCNRAPRCSDDRFAQIHNDLGNVHMILGEIEGEKSRPGETSRYVDAIKAYQEARNQWNHALPTDTPMGALAANNQGLAKFRLAQKLAKDKPQRAAMFRGEARKDFRDALQVWQSASVSALHHCGWAMTQRNLSSLCGDDKKCVGEHAAAAETAEKAGKCPG